MQFNQFQKELQKRNIDPQIAYMFTLVYERLIETSRELTTCTNLLAELANSVSGFVQLNVMQQDQIKHLLRHGRPDGIEIESVAHDPNDGDD